MLELLGRPPPRWTEGRNVAPLLHDREVAPVPLFAELEPQVAVRSAQFKWIIDEKTGATQAFDLAADGPMDLVAFAARGGAPPRYARD